MGIAYRHRQQPVGVRRFPHLRRPDVPIVQVVVNLDGVDIFLNDDVGRIVTGMAVNAENPAAGQEQLADLILVKGVLPRPNFNLPAGNKDDLAGEMPFHQLPKLGPPFPIMVVGNGNAVNAPALNLPDYLLGNGQRGRLEVKGFPNVRMQVQFDFHLAPFLSLTVKSAFRSP